MINIIKNKVENFFNFEMNEESMLRFDSYDQDLNKYKENLKIKHEKHAIFIVVIVVAMVVCSKLDKIAQLLGILGRLVIVGLIFAFVYSSLIYIWQELAIRFPRLLPYCYPIPVIFILWLFNYVLSNASLWNIISIGCLGLLSIIFLGIELIKLIPTYLNYTIGKQIALVLGIMTVLAKLESKTEDNDLLLMWTFYIIGLNIIMLLMDYYQSRAYKSSLEKLYKILVSSDSDDAIYKKLVECYYIGGEKIKEKIMLNEKFLKIILEKESESLEKN